MRVVGIFTLGLGITLLVPCGFFLANAARPGQVLGGLLCTALVPVPMIVGGILLVRRAEEGPAAGRVPEEAVPPPPAGVGNPIHGTLERVRGFDLNRLNWVGWLLLLATFGFVLAEAGPSPCWPRAAGWAAGRAV